MQQRQCPGGRVAVGGEGKAVGKEAFLAAVCCATAGVGRARVR